MTGNSNSPLQTPSSGARRILLVDADAFFVAVARQGNEGLAQTRSRRTSGSRKSCLANWLKKADVEEGVKPGVTEKESAELRDARKRIRLLEQEAEVMRRAVAYLSRDVNPK